MTSEIHPSVYEEQTFIDEVRQGVHVDMAARALGPSDDDIDRMTPEELRALCDSWGAGVAQSYN